MVERSLMVTPPLPWIKVHSRAGLHTLEELLVAFLSGPIDGRLKPCGMPWTRLAVLSFVGLAVGIERSPIHSCAPIHRGGQHAYANGLCRHGPARDRRPIQLDHGGRTCRCSVGFRR